MAVRLKKLHESAQARYDKSKECLVEAVAKQPQAPAGAHVAALLPSQPYDCALPLGRALSMLSGFAQQLFS